MTAIAMELKAPKIFEQVGEKITTAKENISERIQNAIASVKDEADTVKQAYKNLPLISKIKFGIYFIIGGTAIYTGGNEVLQYFQNPDKPKQEAVDTKKAKADSIEDKAREDAVASFKKDESTPDQKKLEGGGDGDQENLEDGGKDKDQKNLDGGDKPDTLKVIATRDLDSVITSYVVIGDLTRGILGNIKKTQDNIGTARNQAEVNSCLERLVDIYNNEIKNVKNRILSEKDIEQFIQIGKKLNKFFEPYGFQVNAPTAEDFEYAGAVVKGKKKKKKPQTTTKKKTDQNTTTTDYSQYAQYGNMYNNEAVEQVKKDSVAIAHGQEMLGGGK